MLHIVGIVFTVNIDFKRKITLRIILKCIPYYHVNAEKITTSVIIIKFGNKLKSIKCIKYFNSFTFSNLSLYKY